MSDKSVYEMAREAFNKYAGIDVNAYEPECPHLRCSAGSKHCLDCGKPSDIPLDRVSVLDKFPVWTRLQIRLAAWKGRNFGASGDDTKGIGEELGEAAMGLLGMVMGSGACLHASLKTEQKIRGFDDPEKGRLAISDGIADAIIFAIQLCTSFRLDFQTLITETAAEVLKRDWVKNQTNAHEVAQQKRQHVHLNPPNPHAREQAQRAMAEQALKRPANYSQLPFSEQWAIDKRLGILDWDGTGYKPEPPSEGKFMTPAEQFATFSRAPDASCETTPDGDCVSTDPDCMHQPAPDTAEILRKHDAANSDTFALDALIADHQYTPHVRWPRDACDFKVSDSGSGRARLCGRAKGEHRQ